MNHLFIINPVAGGKKSLCRQVDQEIRSFLDNKNLTYDIYYTTAPMDAARKVRLAAQSGSQLRVYACGGDGTLNECINGAAGFPNAAVTHFPCGTGNDFIRTFGEEDAARFHDIAALVDGFVRPIDLIDCNGRYGVSICSVGIDARIGRDVHRYSALPAIGGATGYVVSMVVNFLRGVNERYTITTETESVTGSFALVCACNGRFYGGGFNPVPEAMPDDGFLDFLSVKAVSRLKFLTVVGKYAKGRYKELTDIISYRRGQTMTIQGDDELDINIDGEILRARELTFTVVPSAVRFLFPAGLRFFTLRDQAVKAP